jgi:hypothetical protein
VSIFYGVDPLVEKTGTPYQYCYQNPVKFIDPDGKKWTPAAKKWADKLDKDMTNQLKGKQKDVDKANNEIKEKGWSQKREDNLNKKTATLNDLSNKFEAIRKEFNALENSTQVYNVIEDASLNAPRTVGQANGIAYGQTLYNTITGEVDIKIPTLDNQLLFFAHEAKHAYQFEIGAFSMGGSTTVRANPLYDQHDELEAFSRGALFGQANMNMTAKQISRDEIYKKLPQGPIDATNHSILSNFLNNPAALQKLSNSFGSVFRINGTTYRPSK